MNDKRLIDANALMRDVMGLTIVSPEAMNYANAVAVAIADSPTIDALEVVRCRECSKHISRSDTDGILYCNFWRKSVLPCGFCYMGAKMDGGAEG